MKRREPHGAKSKPRKSPPVGAGARSVMRAMAEAGAAEQQAATAQILRALSRSTTDPQPVFEAIVEHAHRLTGALYSVLYRYDGEKISIAADRHVSRAASRAQRAVYPRPANRDYLVGRTILEGRTMHSPDLPNDPRFPGSRHAIQKYLPRRALVAVPLMREGVVIGAIATGRGQAKAFTKKEIRLLETFADQAVIAIEKVRLFNETKEALERQTATAEILRVISRSPTDVAPVFETILENAVRLCGSPRAAVFRFDGRLVHLVATRNWATEAHEEMAREYPQPPNPGRLSGRAILNASIVHIEDALSDPSYSSSRAHAGGWRRMLGIPILRDGVPVGAINLTWPDAGKTPEREIEILKTFADQAAIAIENVRLFNETKEALEQQTATSEVLKAISRSTFDLNAVLQVLIENATRLAGAHRGFIFRFDGELARLAYSYDAPPAYRALIEATPLAPGRGSLVGRVLLERRPVHIPDALADREFTLHEAQRAGGFRSMLGVPMLREGKLIGVIAVWATEVRPFTDSQIALVSTFADQAVIAIENVRLFNETKEALEQQTATAEILKVISSSPTDTRPVFQAIAERAGRICEAMDARIFVVEGPQLRYVAGFGDVSSPEIGGTRPLDRGIPMGRAVIEGRPVQVEDLQAVPHEYPLSLRQLGLRTVLAVPLMRENQALGAILLRRLEVRPFSEKQIALLKTFADQAAIAIENVRLFNETKESLERETASGEVLSVIAGTPADAQPVFDAIAQSALRLFGVSHVGITVLEGDSIRSIATAGSADPRGEFVFPLNRDSTAGRSMLDRTTINIGDTEAPDSPSFARDSGRLVGFRAIAAAPMLREGAAIGSVHMMRKTPGPFSDAQMDLLKTFANQAVIAIENARLFREIREKSAQLEVADKHKSEFLANMSHELRTPLNAIIGFSEALGEKMFGELNEKQSDYLKDIHESGRHLLSLINDILDLSKIEAGRMDLEISSFDLPAALSNAMTLIRERAQRHSIKLGLDVDERLGEFQADERKFKQIMLNLLSNAVKFTPDGGKVNVSARRFDGKVEVAVRDTGIGIAPEDQAVVFEEFKQVGRDRMRRAEGTGLGLALTRRFVELHGGAIRLESAPGKGSTFTVELPLRH